MSILAILALSTASTSSFDQDISVMSSFFVRKAMTESWNWLKKFARKGRVVICQEKMICLLFSTLNSVSEYMWEVAVVTSGTFCNMLRMKKNQTCDDGNLATLLTNQWKRMVLAKEPNKNPLLDLIGFISTVSILWYVNTIHLSLWNSLLHLLLCFTSFPGVFPRHVRNTEQSFTYKKWFEKLLEYVRNYLKHS